MSSQNSTYAYPSNMSNAELEQRTKAYLASRSFLSFRRLTVQASGGVVTLTGRLPTYYERQIAQETVRRVAGVQRVIDRIWVGDDPALERPRFARGERPIELAEEAGVF